MKKRILIIDDNNEFRKLLKIILQENYTIETAENGLRAFSILQSGYLPDLVLCDLMMPEVDGKTFLNQLKVSGAFCKIPVILLSSIDKSATRVDLLKAGAIDYIIKPFNPEELKVRISNALLLTAKEPMNNKAYKLDLS